MTSAGKKFKGVSSLSGPCFLNSDGIKTYSDCFQQDKLRNVEIGLLK